MWTKYLGTILIIIPNPNRIVITGMFNASHSYDASLLLEQREIYTLEFPLHQANFRTLET